MKRKTKTEPSALGRRWKSLREGLKLTQSQLAEKLGVSAPYLSLIENGLRPCPSIDVVRKLHSLSKKSIDFIAGGDLA